MYYIIYPTEKCNLTCHYCCSDEEAMYREKGTSYPFETIKKFIEKDPKAYLHMYGGEPLLEVDFIKKMALEVKHRGLCIQTNGTLLDRLPEELFDRIYAIYVSVDGTEKTTDSYRGKGVYSSSIGALKRLRKRGYKGLVGARMTTTPGVNIYNAVNHLISGCEFKFDLVYWQLNMLFDPYMWQRDKERITQWVKLHYNPLISVLLKEYTERIISGEHKVNIVPFSGLLNSFLKGEIVNNLRCGAGHQTFTISRKGEIFPCPVMRYMDKYNLGNISDDIDLKKVPNFLVEPCTSCSYMPVCGGRCLYANAENPWDKEGFELVCSTVKHLIDGVKKYTPAIRKAIKEKKIDYSQITKGIYDFEIIP